MKRRYYSAAGGAEDIVNNEYQFITTRFARVALLRFRKNRAADIWKRQNKLVDINVSEREANGSGKLRDFILVEGKHTNFIKRERVIVAIFQSF